MDVNKRRKMFINKEKNHKNEKINLKNTRKFKISRKQAVKEGVITRVGGIREAVKELRRLIGEREKEN